VWTPLDMSKAARRATLQCIPRRDGAQTLMGRVVPVGAESDLHV